MAKMTITGLMDLSQTSGKDVAYENQITCAVKICISASELWFKQILWELDSVRNIFLKDRVSVSSF